MGQVNPRGGTGGGDPMAILRPKATVRGTIHAAVTLFFWCLFVYWWLRVIPQTSVRDAVGALILIAFTFLATTVLTLFWVRHNIAIFRRKGPRKGLPPVSEECGADRLGRALDHPGFDSLKRSRVVAVSTEGNRKRFSIPRSG